MRKRAEDAELIETDDLLGPDMPPSVDNAIEKINQAVEMARDLESKNGDARVELQREVDEMIENI
eukprot:COSAG02_NODE_39686_length_414_cov_0.653968_1_plen_64_part_10